MNKMGHTSTFYRLGSAFLFFSFLLAGCASSPTETRYDDRIKTYGAASDEKATIYYIGDHDKATAHYILRDGDRPDFQRKSVQTAYQPQMPSGNENPTYEEQVADLQMVLDVSDIHFDFDKSVIKQSAVPELDKWAEFFQKNPQVTAEIYGHADSTGPSAYNQKLSMKRAQAVVNYLAMKGVDPKRLTAKGFGESMPAAPNTTSEGRQKNRRVELNL